MQTYKPMPISARFQGGRVIFYVTIFFIFDFVTEFMPFFMQVLIQFSYESQTPSSSLTKKHLLSLKIKWWLKASRG